MTKLKRYCLFFLSLALPLTLSLSFPLSSFNLCLCFSDWYTHFTKILRLRNPKWVCSHDKQINFYRLESCWSWKLFDYLQDTAEFCGRDLSLPLSLSGLLLSHGLHILLLCQCHKPFMKLLISVAAQIYFAQPFTLEWICNGELQNMSKGPKCCILRSLKHC